jgi:hypothetical protein
VRQRAVMYLEEHAPVVDGLWTAGGGGRWVKCATCGSSFRATRRGVTEIKVWGEDANEVQAVIRQLAADDVARREAARLRSPWFSGLFYLMVAVVIISLLLVVGAGRPSSSQCRR